MRPYQLLHCLQHNIAPETHNLDPELLAPLDLPDRPDRRICAFIRKKLASAGSLEAALGVFSARERARACCKDGFFTGLGILGRDEEDQLVAVGCIGCRSHGSVCMSMNKDEKNGRKLKKEEKTWNLRQVYTTRLLPNVRARMPNKARLKVDYGHV